MPSQLEGVSHLDRVEAENGNLGRMYAVGVMSFILFLSTLVGVPVLPRLSTELGADRTDIPMVVSSAVVTVVVLQFFTGVLADRYSRRTLILVSSLLGSATSLLCAVATHWSQLLILRIAGGAADAIAMPAILAITASLAEGRQGRFFGILRSSQGLSFVVGPMLGSAFSLVSLRTPFVVDGILSLAVFVVALFVMPGREAASPGHRLSPLRGLKRTFAERRVYLYLLLGVSGLFAFGILFSFVPAKAEVLGLESWQVGAILGFGALIYSVVSFFAGRLSDNVSRRMLVVVSEMAMLVAVAGLHVASGFALLVAFYGLFCVGEASVCLLSFAYAAKVFDKEQIGTSMGAFDSVMDLSLFAGPVLGALLYKTTGLTGPVFLLASLPAICALFAASLWLTLDAK